MAIVIFFLLCAYWQPSREAVGILVVRVTTWPPGPIDSSDDTCCFVSLCRNTFQLPSNLGIPHVVFLGHCKQVERIGVLVSRGGRYFWMG